jgi:hypothetical protein
VNDHLLLAKSLKYLLDIISPQLDILDDEQFAALLGSKPKISLSTEEGKLLKRSLEDSLAAIDGIELERLHFDIGEEIDSVAA